MFRTHDGLELYYEIHGQKEHDSCIVLLNGLTQSTASWAGIVPYLAADHCIVLLDLIFQGRSAKAKHHRSYDEHADDVAALLRHLNISSAAIAGISYGGGVAQHLAVNHPKLISKLILVSTFAHKTPLFNALGDSWVAALKAGGYPLMLEVMLPVVLGESYFNSPLIPIETLKQMRIGNDLQTNDILKLIKATEQREDYREKLKNINAPTLIVHGEEDLLIPVKMAEEIRRNIKDSRFHLIRNAGHTLNLEAIPELGRTIKEFINS